MTKTDAERAKIDPTRAPLPPRAAGPDTKTYPFDFPFLRAWNSMMGSDAGWSAERVALARREDAPTDAIYRRVDGGWVRYRDIRSVTTRMVLDGILARWVENAKRAKREGA